jgi:ribosome-associated protein
LTGKKRAPAGRAARSATGPIPQNQTGSEALRDRVLTVLDDRKGLDVTTLDVRGLTDITDWMIIVSGTSRRHVKALVDYLIEAAKAVDKPPLGVEGRETHDWVLVDLNDVLVHVMQADAREFYDLERLWHPLVVAGTETGV